MTLAANKLPNVRRRVNRARKNINGQCVTCPASRHLHIMAERLATGKPYPMLADEPEHCAGSMLSVLESLWKARAELNRRAMQWRKRRTSTAAPGPIHAAEPDVQNGGSGVGREGEKPQ